MTESEWTRLVCEEMSRCNTIIFPCVASKMQAAGWPDRWVCHKLWCGWLEFKGENTLLTVKQHHIIYSLNKRQPCSAFVVRWPNRIENEEGELITHFDGHGKTLLQQLSKIIG